MVHEDSAPVAGAGVSAADMPRVVSHACPICAEEFCREDECRRTLTHPACCTQVMCCACMYQQSKRCRCHEDCDAVVAWCPFCREVCGVDALDVFLAQRPLCADCRERGGEDTAAVSAEVVAVTVETGAGSGGAGALDAWARARSLGLLARLLGGMVT